MNQNYLFKHWLSTLLLAPFLPVIYEFAFKPIPGQIVGLVEVYPITVVFSFIFSLPTLIIYYFTFRLLSKKNIRPWVAKLILISLTIIGITITICLIGGSLAITFILAYSLASIITGLIFNIKIVSGAENKLNKM